MTMPSQRRSLAIRSFGRTERSIGSITVGPVTTMMAPNRKDNSMLKPTR